jgi:polar amino acid transport system substrate-binding protein
MFHLSIRRVVALPLLLVLAVLLAACGSSSSNSSSTTSTSAPSSSVASGGVAKDPTIAAEVPQAIASKGTLSVATDASYPPMEYFASNNSTIIGADVDLGKAIGQVLGLNFNFVNAGFDSIIPGLASGKYDLSLSSFTDNKEREKTVDFVTYAAVGTSFMIKKGGTPVTSLADLCGKTVGVEKGTTELDDATAQNTKCKAAGKPGVTINAYPDQNGANLNLANGRVQVVMLDAPPAVYEVQQSHGQFAISGKQYGTAPYGIAIPKGNGMAKPIQAALKKLIADGTYQQILTKWHIQQFGITNPVINGATS